MDRRPSPLMLVVRVGSLLLLAACGGGGARPAEGPGALTSSNCPPADSAGAVTPQNADVAILATVRIEQLRVEEAPRTATELPSSTPVQIVECDERVNLERPVRAGRTYRNVEIRYRLMTRIDTAAARAAVDSAVARADTARRP
jgi:hypothetical protein